MATAYLGIGANIGDRIENIQMMLNLLGHESDIAIKKVSSLYETQPIGVPNQPDYINCVIEIETEILPHDLLAAVKSIEAILGRDPETHNEPRTMDIDILLYDNLNIDSLDLKIPHSRLTERRFVLEPLLEIAPKLNDPKSMKPLKGFLSKTKSQKTNKVMSAKEVWNG